MELNDSEDLVKFINKEKKKSKDLDVNHSYKSFCRSIPKIITTLYKRIYNIKEINPVDVVILGCNMYYNIYWFILRYTNNYKVALFLSGSAVDLFLDSLISSYESIRDNPFKISPNVNDSIRYAYKKRIGPLHCFINNNNKDIDNSQMAAQIINTFMIQIMRQIINNNILPCGNDIEQIKDNNNIPPKIDILLDFIQNQNKVLIDDILVTIHLIINQNSEDSADKLYYQINNYIDNYPGNEDNKKKYSNEIEWVNDKQKQVITIFSYINSLITFTKEYLH